MKIMIFLVWIPAFAGMTKGGDGNDERGDGNDERGMDSRILS
jgi:hypothetical protein